MFLTIRLFFIHSQLEAYVLLFGLLVFNLYILNINIYEPEMRLILTRHDDRIAVPNRGNVAFITARHQLLFLIEVLVYCEETYFESNIYDTVFDTCE
jgi:hypothetical protein